MSIACLGGWCADRDRCAHHHNTSGQPVIERLCEAGQSDAFAPIRFTPAPAPRPAEPETLEAA